MYTSLPDAVAGRWIVRDPVKGAFPVPFYSQAVARDFAWLLNTVPELPSDESEAGRMIHLVRRCGAPLCEC